MADVNLWLFAAGVVSILTMGVHVFVGGPQVVRPLLAARDVDPVPLATAYYCWHIVTMTLAAMGAGYFLSVMTGAPDAALIATAMAAGFTIWNIVLIMRQGLPWLEMGQWALFAPITFLGVMGLV